MRPTDGFVLAGEVSHRGLDLAAPVIPVDRDRHPYGGGPFARLVMPVLPSEPGLYLWVVEGAVLYVGQTRMTLRQRLGSNGYSTISAYNTLARQPGKRNGGQQTNCRINALANVHLSAGGQLSIYVRTTAPDDALGAEAEWMATFGSPPWNLAAGRAS